jgi:hypothetical protein
MVLFFVINEKSYLLSAESCEINALFQDDDRHGKWKKFVLHTLGYFENIHNEYSTKSTLWKNQICQWGFWKHLKLYWVTETF